MAVRIRSLAPRASLLRHSFTALAASHLTAAAFASSAAPREVAPFPADFYFRQLSPGTEIALSRSPAHAFARKMGNFIYLVGDKATGSAIVIDGAWDPEGIEAVAAADNMTIVSHVATHYHWDHIGSEEVNGVRVPGIKDWVGRGLPVHVPSVELADAAAQTAVSPDALSPLSHGQCLAIGQFGIVVMDTPGHSPGSCCLRVTDGVPSSAAAAAGDADEPVRDLLLVTGDTVFPGSCGRLDLPGSDKRAMYDSLRSLALLPDALPIYPGHVYSGRSSTVAAEKSGGLLRDISRAQWQRMMG